MFAAFVRIDNSAQATINAQNVRIERSDRCAIALNFGQILGKQGHFWVRGTVTGDDTDFGHSGAESTGFPRVQQRLFPCETARSHRIVMRAA